VFTFEQHGAGVHVERAMTNGCVLTAGISDSANHSILLDDIEQDLVRLSPASGDQRGTLVSFSGLPGFVGRGAVDGRYRHIQQTEIHGHLSAMVAQVTDVLPHHHASWGGEQDVAIHLE